MFKSEKHSSVLNSKIEDKSISALRRWKIPLIYNNKLGHFQIDEERWRHTPEWAKVKTSDLLKADAKDWLAGMLANGPMKIQEVREAAKAYGMNNILLARAAKSLGLVLFKEGKHKCWRIMRDDEKVIIGRDFIELEIDDDTLPWE